MELVISTAIVCLTLFSLVRYIPTTITPSFTIHVHPLPTISEDDEIYINPAPRSIADYINMESEPFARDALWAEANRLYAIHEDWTVVESEMSGPVEVGNV